jgi:hypothetical protein
MSTAKNAILRAKLNGVLTELLVRTNAEQVMYNENTTLAAHLATLATSASVEQLQQTINGLGALASKSEVSYNELAQSLKTLIDGKVDVTVFNNTLEQSGQALQAVTDRVGALETAQEGNVGAFQEISARFNELYGVTEEDKTADSGKSIRTIANEELVKQLIPENAAEALNELQEIADWIQSHPGDASAMNSAITALQNKLVLGTNAEGTEYTTVKAYVEAAIAAAHAEGDYATAEALRLLGERVGAVESKTANLGTLANKSIITESEVDSALMEKINASAQGNHSHSNKELLDTYTQTEANLADAVAKKHSHDNKDVLDGISTVRVNAWDAKTTVYYAAEEPTAMQNGDLWFQIVD